MDLVSRLIATVLGGVLLAVMSLFFVPSPVYAFGMVGKQNVPWYVCDTAYNTRGESNTASGACQLAVSQIPSSVCDNNGGTAKYSLGPPLNDKAWYLTVTGCGTTSNTGYASWQGPGQKFACPENAQELGPGSSSCECMLGTKAVGGKCEPYTCPAKGGYQAVTQPDVKLPNAGDSFCDGGCQFQPSSWKVDQEGQVWGVWPFKSAAKTCGGKKDAAGVTTGTDGQTPAPVACGPSQCPGNVNGTDVCVPCRSQTTNGPSTSASGVQPGDQKDPLDDSKNIAKTDVRTDCTGAVCTTTYTYSNSRGEVIGEKTEEAPAEDYCQKNPQANQCKKDSFGGACDAGFQCEGDAIQCALAKEVHQRNCQWFKDPPVAMREAGEKALAGGVQPDWHPYKQAGGGTPFSLSSALDRSDALGGGGCPADTVFGVMGQTLTISWSQFCGSLAMLGNIAVALTALACAFIVFRE